MAPNDFAVEFRCTNMMMVRDPLLEGEKAGEGKRKRTFKTAAEAQAFADELLQFFKKLYASANCKETAPGSWVGLNFADKPVYSIEQKRASDSAQSAPKAPAEKLTPDPDKSVKLWPQPPSHPEAEAHIKAFFQLLRDGKLEEAKGKVAHAYPDWDDTLFTVWQDHYLIHEIPKDKSFEGGEWKNDRRWLKDLTIEDGFEWIKEDRCYVNFVYKGRPSGYLGEFAILKASSGYYLQRVIFKMG